MKIVLRTFLFGCLLVASAVFAFNLGRGNVRIEEYKIYEANLIRLQHFETNASPELKDFMKGRYYYLANRIPKSWMSTPYDYGQVSTNMHLAVGKGDTGPQYEYRIFKERNSAFRDPETGQTNKAVLR